MNTIYLIFISSTLRSHSYAGAIDGEGKIEVDAAGRLVSQVLGHWCVRFAQSMKDVMIERECVQHGIMKLVSWRLWR